MATTLTPQPKATPTAPTTGSTPGLIRTFLLDHERLIIVVLVVALFWWGYGKYADIRANEADKTLQAQKLVTAAQQQADAQLAQQVAADKAAQQALQDKITAQNAQLAQANVQLATALAQRQKTDANLPLPDLATRWEQLVPNITMTANPNGTLTVPQSAAVATVQQLEQVPALKAELANETTAKQGDDQLLLAANKSIFDLDAQVLGAQKLDADHQQQCTDEKNVMKAQFRKSKRRWFIIGYVAGFISRQAMKIPTGL